MGVPESHRRHEEEARMEKSRGLTAQNVRKSLEQVRLGRSVEPAAQGFAGPVKEFCCYP